MPIVVLHGTQKYRIDEGLKPHFGYIRPTSQVLIQNMYLGLALWKYRD
jgi:hypothetical protein